MNILITAPSLNPQKNVSGISTVVQTIIANNKQHTYFHYLLGRPDKKLSKVSWLLQLVKQVCFFPSALKKQQIDLVHQNLPFDPKGLLRESIINLWCRLYHIPVFLHVHGGLFLMNPPHNPFYRFLARRLFKQSKAVVVLSELEKDAIAKFYNFSDAQVLMNSIDTSIFAAIHEKRQDDKPVLLFMGRIHESKGIEDIIEALRLLKKEMDFRFMLCGDGPLKELCIRECRQILNENFEYRGVVSGNEKLRTIGDADLFLLPSRYGEGLPMALLETMAAGVVSVVTDDASMKFVVQNEVNGMRVEKGDPKDLFNQLKKVLSERDLYVKLSRNAKETIVSKYDIKSYIRQLNDIYSKIIEK